MLWRPSNVRRASAKQPPRFWGVWVFSSLGPMFNRGPAEAFAGAGLGAFESARGAFESARGGGQRASLRRRGRRRFPGRARRRARGRGCGWRRRRPPCEPDPPRALPRHNEDAAGTKEPQGLLGVFRGLQGVAVEEDEVVGVCGQPRQEVGAAPVDQPGAPAAHAGLREGLPRGVLGLAFDVDRGECDVAVGEKVEAGHSGARSHLDDGGDAR